MYMLDCMNQKISFESRIESAAAIRILIKSQIESGYSRLRVIIIITDEQRCADSPGSSNNIARSLLQCSRVCILLLHST